MEVNSLKGLISHQIHEIYRQKGAEYVKGKTCANNGKSIRENSGKEAVAPFKLTTGHDCLAQMKIYQSSECSIATSKYYHGC